MRLTRRHLLAAAGAGTAFAITERGVRTATSAVGRALTAMRPAATGTTADACALCGARDHAMLDPRCPRSRPGRTVA